MSIDSVSAVSRVTRNFLLAISSLSSRTTCSPPMSGRCMSSSTRSGRSERASRIPSCPVLAFTSVMPGYADKAISTSDMLIGLSSM